MDQGNDVRRPLEGCFSPWTDVIVLDDNGHNIMVPIATIHPGDYVLTDTGFSCVQYIVITRTRREPEW
jgi:hypothetical protein